jgi:hypothetical protein
MYYNATEKTCVRSVVAVSPGRVHHDYAKFVRADKTRCGPNGKWFTEIIGKDGLVKSSFEIK